MSGALRAPAGSRGHATLQVASAAVLRQEGDHRLHLSEVRTVSDEATDLLAADEIRMHKRS